MNARYTGDAREPDGLYCLTGLTQGQPGCADYYAVQNAKLKKYRLGLPDGAEREAVGELIATLDILAARLPALSPVARSNTHSFPSACASPA